MTATRRGKYKVGNRHDRRTNPSPEIPAHDAPFEPLLIFQKGATDPKVALNLLGRV